MSKKQKTQEIADISVEASQVEVLDTEIVEEVVEITDISVDDTIVFATPQLQEAWTGEKLVEDVKESIVGEYDENELVTFRLKNGNLHFGRYGAIVKMGYKPEGAYKYPSKK